MNTKEMLEKLRGVNNLCVQKRRHYNELKEALADYATFEKVTAFINNALADIENEIFDIVMYKYAVDYRVMQLSNSDAVDIIRKHYFDDIPFEYLADDYGGGEDYVQETFDEAMTELTDIDVRSNKKIC